MRPRFIYPSVCSTMAAIIALCALPLPAETIVEQTAGTQDVIQVVFFGQSFTSSGGGPWRNISFSFFSDRGVTPAAGGVAFVFTSPYSGRPSALSASLPVARSTGISNGSYVFDPSFVLQPNTRYFVYANTIAANIPGGINLSIASMAGGNLFTCCIGGLTFRGRPGSNANFRVSGSPVAEPPVMIQRFTPARVNLYTTHALYFEIRNPNHHQALTGIAFTDSLPSGLVIGTPSNVSNNCGGSATATSTVSSVIALSGGTLGPQASCTISVDVKALKPEQFTNNTGAITSDQSGPGMTATAGLHVVSPGVVNKVFAAATVPLAGATSLTVTVHNPNPGVDLINMGFSDDLPGGLQIASPNHLAGSCIADHGAAVTAAPGSHNITLWSLVLGGANPTSCTISVDVVGVQAGSQQNTNGPVTATF